MTAVAERPAARRARRAGRRRRPPTAGWWGDGPAPWLEWPGVTIELPARWNPDRPLPARDPFDADEQPRFGAWESLDGHYWYDQDAADRACDFFPQLLTHYKGEFAGQPFTLMRWQEWLVVRPLFGWRRATDNLRRFRILFLAVPKGNGKSPLGAGIGLFLTFCDDEDGAEVFAAAADREQAGVVFENARVMVEQSALLDERAQVLRRVIYVPGTRSSYKVCSADAATKHGPAVHGLVFDEFHAQPNRLLYETLQRGTVKRRQPLTLLLTTAGDDDESICAEEWDYARAVQSGTSPDETYLPVIFEARPDDDWRDPAVWRRVNPGFGISVKADAIARECQAAINEPRKLNDFLRFHLNRWVNQVTAWIPVDWWDQRCRQPLEPDAALQALELGAGLDLSQKYDLTALVLVFRRPLAGAAEAIEVVAKDEVRDQVTKRSLTLNFEIELVPFFWIPRDTMREREREDRVPYTQWEAEGFLRVTDGDVVDYDAIYRAITTTITKRFPRLRQAEMGYDPAFATQLALQLQGAGHRVVETPQNYRHLSEPAQVFEALVRGGRVRHGGHPVLRQHLENVGIRQDDAGRIRPVKPRRRKRIDGVVGSLLGLGRLIANPAGVSGWRAL